MLYLKKLYTSWYSCILHINTVIVGYCYLVSHLADQTPAPSQRLFNLLRTWSDVSTFLHRGVLIVTASSHVILMAVWHDSKGTKQWNNETYICWDGVYTIVQVCNIVYIYTTVCIYICYISIYTYTCKIGTLYGLLLPKEHVCALPNHLDAAHTAWSKCRKNNIYNQQKVPRSRSTSSDLFLKKIDVFILRGGKKPPPPKPAKTSHRLPPSIQPNLSRAPEQIQGAQTTGGFGRTQLCLEAMEPKKWRKTGSVSTLNPWEGQVLNFFGNHPEAGWEKPWIFDELEINQVGWFCWFGAKGGFGIRSGKDTQGFGILGIIWRGFQDSTPPGPQFTLSWNMEPAKKVWKMMFRNSIDSDLLVPSFPFPGCTFFVAGRKRRPAGWERLKTHEVLGVLEVRKGRS